MAQKLTKTAIDDLRFENDVGILWDTMVSGFGVKVSSTGRKTFLLKYRDLSNRQRKPTIGRYGDITLQQARSIAQQMKAELAAGKDPNAVRAALRNSPYLNDFADTYFLTADKKKTTINYERSIYKKHLHSTLGKRTVSSIQRTDVQVWVNRLQNTTGGAGRTFSMLRAIFNEALRQDLLNNGANPCAGVRVKVGKPKNRFLTVKELANLMTTLSEGVKSGAISIRMAVLIRLALFTGARKTELLSMKWSYIDKEAHVIRLPDSKTGARSLFLSNAALEELESLPRSNSSVYVFPGKTEETYLKDPRKAFKSAIGMAGISDFRFHDLRHTHASWGVKSGLSLYLVSKTLGHKQARTSERYAHIDSEPSLLAVNTISSAMIEAASSS